MTASNLLRKNLSHWFLFMALIAAALVLLAWLARSPHLTAQPSALSMGITADLVLMLPLAWFLFIRKRQIPNITVVPVTILGLTLATSLLPANAHTFTNFAWQWLVPVLELGVLSYVGYSVYKMRKAIKGQKQQHQDPMALYLAALGQLQLPPLAAKLMASEFAMLHYALFSWRARPLQAKPGTSQFTYHKTSGLGAFMAGIMLLLLAETVGLHFLIGLWSSTAAWVLTALSLYSILFIIAHARASRLRPFSVENGHLTLRHGLLYQTTIPLEAIEKAEATMNDLPESLDKKSLLSLGIMGSLGGHNLVLWLNTPQQAAGMYGVKKSFSVVALHTDEPKALQALLQPKNGTHTAG